MRGVQAGGSVTPEGESARSEDALLRFDFETREVQTIASGVTGIEVSSDGSFLLARRADGGLATASIADKIELEGLDTSGLQLLIDPRAEWAQIFEDAVRMQPAYF